MGYYSFTCAKTGLPAVSNDSGCDQKFYRVLVLTADGSVLRGEYDGYGGVGRYSQAAQEVGGAGGDKLVLEHFYRGESYAQLPSSGSDPAQGGFDPLLHPAMFHAQETVAGFDGKQYQKRDAQLNRMKAAAGDYFNTIYGISELERRQLADAIERAEDCERGDGDEASDRLLQMWSAVLDKFPGGIFPSAHPLAGKGPKEAIQIVQADIERTTPLLVDELIAAWCEARAVRELDFEALRCGQAVWRSPTVESTPPVRRPRM